MLRRFLGVENGDFLSKVGQLSWLIIIVFEGQNKDHFQNQKDMDQVYDI